MHLPIEKFPHDFNTWTHICKNIFSLIDNSNLQLIQYKILHKSTYYTTQKV